MHVQGVLHRALLAAEKDNVKSGVAGGEDHLGKEQSGLVIYGERNATVFGRRGGGFPPFLACSLFNILHQEIPIFHPSFLFGGKFTVFLGRFSFSRIFLLCCIQYFPPLTTTTQDPTWRRRKNIGEKECFWAAHQLRRVPAKNGEGKQHLHPVYK